MCAATRVCRRSASARPPRRTLPGALLPPGRSRRAGGRASPERAASRTDRLHRSARALHSCLWLVEHDDGTDLDRSGARRRNARAHGNGLVEIARIDEVESAQLLLGLGERPVRRRNLAVADADGRCRLSWLQRLTRDVLTAL